jgi:UDP-galactopyranose mutase
VQQTTRIRGARTVVVIGAGPAGAATARLCADAGCDVRVFEKRPHVGGNCFDEKDRHGVRVHRYGPHYFRTSSTELLQWLSRFTEWVPGRYFVRARVGRNLVPMPVSLATMTALTGRPFTAGDFQAYLDEHRKPIAEPRNAEEQCLATVGSELYELLFRGYTLKQWGVDPRELAASVTARIPLRFNWDERYPQEDFQVMPRNGYSAQYENMLDHGNISVETGVSVSSEDVRSDQRSADATIYTGPIDHLFDDVYGPLGYRSLRFRWRHHKDRFVQPCVQINYPNDHEYTRTVEIKHLTGDAPRGTTICYEYPMQSGEPFYPLLTEENNGRYERYRALAEAEQQSDRPLYLVGRLAEFKYFNMDHVLLRASELAGRILKEWT